MADKVTPIPAGFHAVTPYLVVRGAAAAIDFYKKAFGAEEHFRMPAPGGSRLMHAEIQIGDSIIFLCDEMLEMGAKSPADQDWTPVGIYLYVANVDEVFDRAVAAGAKVRMPVQDMFWGDRYGQLVDPFGHHWSIASRVEELSLDCSRGVVLLLQELLHECHILCADIGPQLDEPRPQLLLHETDRIVVNLPQPVRVGAFTFE
jgi:uncharacterized glyoxalase superfamily protein PhnB